MDNNYKILLVDDEIGIAEGLVVLLQRMDHPWTFVGIAEDGKQGIEMVEQFHPDIIVTDIRMPIMDGLEMIRKIKESYPAIRFIILSGFPDFAYAKQAIQLGVSSYVIKPVDEDELEKSLIDICKEIDRERFASKQYYHEKRKWFWKNLISGNELIESSFLIPEKLKQMQSLCVLFEINQYDGISLKGKLTDTVLESILNDAFKNNEYCYLFHERSDRLAALFMFDQTPNQDYLLSITNAIRNRIERIIDGMVSAGVGELHYGATEMFKSYEEAQKCLNNKVFLGIGALFTYQEMKKERPLLVTELEIQNLEQAIKDNNKIIYKRVVTNLFFKLREQTDLFLSDVQRESLNLVLCSIRSMPTMQFQLYDYLGKNILSLERIKNMHDLEQIENWVINLIDTITLIIHSKSQTKKKELIEEIKEYVELNYNKDISLNDLSERFFLNPYYISQLFKKKIGTSYQNYVTQLRIESAKRYLKETTLMVYEIGDMVGYHDTTYFSRIFEKTVGKRPSDYRKKFERP